jgi:hypothetical protein
VKSPAHDSYELLPEVESLNRSDILAPEPNWNIGGLAQMRRRPVKAGWRLLMTVAVLFFPLLFVFIWSEASRFTRHFWQVAPLDVAKWSVVALLVTLVAVFIDQRGRR